MTLKDCYMQMGADYEETVQRLRSESLIQRISFQNFLRIRAIRSICQALADGNIEVAFRAAHTLKGVCQNLGFEKSVRAKRRADRAVKTAAGDRDG